MLVLLGLTYWAFMGISLGVLSNLLLGLSHWHGVMIIGFFLLAQATKLLAEAVFMKQKAQVLELLQKQVDSQQNKEKVNDQV